MWVSASDLLCQLIVLSTIFAAAQQIGGGNSAEDAGIDQNSGMPNVDGINNEDVDLRGDDVASDEGSGLGAGSDNAEIMDELDAVSSDSSSVQDTDEQDLPADDRIEDDLSSQIEDLTPTVVEAPDLVSTPGSPIRLSDLPTIAGVGVPSQVIPFTASAPFMQKSQLPEGTVFICVGALLGFLGCCILAWRGLIAWSLHRSVKKAATSHSLNISSKSMMLRPPGGASFYGAGPGSSVSLDKLGGGKSGGHADGFYNRSSVPYADRRSLFFSPTAGAGLNAAIIASRSSTHLPATATSGPYSATTEATTNVRGNSDSPGLDSTASLNSHIPGTISHLSAHLQGYQRTVGAGNTPPITPSLSPNRRNGPEFSNSMSSKNPNPSKACSGSSTSTPSRPALGRTPSAYLEDLFDNHGNAADGDVVQ